MIGGLAQRFTFSAQGGGPVEFEKSGVLAQEIYSQRFEGPIFQER